MLFYTVFLTLVCGLFWQPVVIRADEAVCANESFFMEKCEVLSEDTTIITQSTDMLVNSTSNSSEISTTEYPTMDSMTVMVNISTNSTCCYDAQLCIDYSIDSPVDNSFNCTRCSAKCMHGCEQDNPEACMCIGEIHKIHEKICDGYGHDAKHCKCDSKCKSLSCYQKHERGTFIGIIIGIVCGVLLIIVSFACLLRHYCCRDGPPPEPVAKQTELVAKRQIDDDDFGNVYGNVDKMGLVKTDSAPDENVTATASAGFNRIDSTDVKINERLLPDIPNDDFGNEYGNVGNNNPAFDTTTPPLPQTVLPSMHAPPLPQTAPSSSSAPLLPQTAPPSLPPPVNITNHPSLKKPPAVPLGPYRPSPKKAETDSSSRRSKQSNLPKQSSIPDSNPPLPPTLPLGAMLMEQLSKLPEKKKKRIVDDESLFEPVTFKPLEKKASGPGGTDKMPNWNSNDFGETYEIPKAADDFGETYEIPNPSSKDFGGSYEIPQPASQTGHANQDFDNSYEPMSKNPTAMHKRNPPALPPQLPDYGQDYEIVVIDTEKQPSVNIPSTKKKKNPPPVQKKKPVVGKKPSRGPPKQPQVNPQDYGETYEAPMQQGSAGQLDYGGDYEAPMQQGSTGQQDYGGDYEAPMHQGSAGQPDYGGDYEAPMTTENFSKEQDYGGDYEAPIMQKEQDFGEDYEVPAMENFGKNQQDFGEDYEAPMLQEKEDPDFGCIYENTDIQLQKSPMHREAAERPREDFNEVYDSPYEYNHPVSFKGKQHGVYYNQQAKKGGPAVSKENYTKLYRT